MAADPVEDLLQRLLDRVRRGGAEQADVFYRAGSSDSVEYENNRLSAISSGATRGVGVRVLAGGRIGFSSTSILDEAEAAADTALELARVAPRVDAPFELPGGTIEADLGDAAVDAISVADLVEAGRAAVDRLRPMADGVLAGAGANRHRSEVALAGSSGLWARYRKSGWSFSAYAQRVEGTSVLSCYDGATSNHRDIDVDAVIEETGAKLRAALTEGRLAAGRRPVVFTPAALNALLGAVRAGVGGAAVFRRTSPLAGRLGEQVLSPQVTLVDDLRPEAGRAGAPCDDEGVPAQAITLVENGVLRNFLCDLRHGARLGRPAGRAGRAGYASMPYPDRGNQSLAAGTTPLAGLLAQAAGGLLVDSVLGLHGSNLTNGDFSVNVGLGFAIEADGELGKRVKDAAIAGNVYQLLGEGLVGLSADRRRSYGGSDLLPWALCADVPVA